MEIKMTNFTTLLNRGIQKHKDKNLKKRFFGSCEGCQKRNLLIEFIDEDSQWSLCDFCYDEYISSSEEE